MWRRVQVWKNASNNLVLLGSCYDVSLYSKAHMSYLIQFAFQQKHCYPVRVPVVIHTTITFIGQTGTFPTNVILWDEMENIPRSGEGLDI